MGLRYKKAHVTHPELKGALWSIYSLELPLYSLYPRQESLKIDRINPTNFANPNEPNSDCPAPNNIGQKGT